MIDAELLDLAARLGDVATMRRVMLAAAESCTGGLVAASITAIAGSSRWFDRAFVTYSNAAKTELLSVSPELIATHGAVSREVAKAMARGALHASNAQWTVAITGVAGPDGGTEDKPVGTVCFAWAGPSGVDVEQRLLLGDRAAIRRDSVAIALSGFIDRLS